MESSLNKSTVYWNPWHGCHKISDGCKNCYMYAQDAAYGQCSDKPRIVKTKFNLPTARDRYGAYKIPSGTVVATCFTSDFFLEEADVWRTSAWNQIRERNDVIFFIITKRVDRIAECLPLDWGNGWQNVIINATAENQIWADRRIPVLLDLPIVTRGLAIAPMLEQIDLRKYLATGKIDTVSVGGESGKGVRICDFDWVIDVYKQCKEFGVAFNFHQTGSLFRMNQRLFRVPRDKEKSQAQKALQFLYSSGDSL